MTQTEADDRLEHVASAAGAATPAEALDAPAPILEPDRGRSGPARRPLAAHEEGGDRVYEVATTQLRGVDGRVRSLHGKRIADGSPFEMKADLVLLAMGFLGPEKSKLLTDLGVRMTERGAVWRDDQWMTSLPGVFAAGDMQRGQSLIVWAIDDGRRAAAAIDSFLAE